MNAIGILIIAGGLGISVLVGWHAVWAVLHGRNHLEIQERLDEATMPNHSSRSTT